MTRPVKRLRMMTATRMVPSAAVDRSDTVGPRRSPPPDHRPRTFIQLHRRAVGFDAADIGERARGVPDRRSAKLDLHPVAPGSQSSIVGLNRHLHRAPMIKRDADETSALEPEGVIDAAVRAAQGLAG